MAGCAQPQHAGGRRALEVLPCDEVQRPLLQPEPDDALWQHRDASSALLYGCPKESVRQESVRRCPQESVRQLMQTRRAQPNLQPNSATPHACSISKPTTRWSLNDGMMAGFSFVPLWPVIGSRLQKMSASAFISFASIPVAIDSLPGMAPAQTHSPTLSACAAQAFLAAHILTVLDLAGQTSRSQSTRRQRRRPQDASAHRPRQHHGLSQRQELEVTMKVERREWMAQCHPSSPLRTPRFEKFYSPFPKVLCACPDETPYLNDPKNPSLQPVPATRWKPA